MKHNKNRLYTIMLSACLLGYIWLYYSLKNSEQSLHFCFIKNATNIPCPACGSTRSILSLLQGNWLDALYINPFGFIGLSILLVTPIWILFDLLVKRESFLHQYNTIENRIKKRSIAIPLILIVVFNWVWNIYKDL